MSMSSAGRAVSSSGCVTKPKARATVWRDLFRPIRRSSPIGTYVMATAAEHREPYESRGSRTVVGARGGEIVVACETNAAKHHASMLARRIAHAPCDFVGPRTRPDMNGNESETARADYSLPRVRKQLLFIIPRLHTGGSVTEPSALVRLFIACPCCLACRTTLFISKQVSHSI